MKTVKINLTDEQWDWVQVEGSKINKLPQAFMTEIALQAIAMYAAVNTLNEDLRKNGSFYMPVVNAESGEFTNVRPLLALLMGVEHRIAGSMSRVVSEVNALRSDVENLVLTKE